MYYFEKYLFYVSNKPLDLPGIYVLLKPSTWNDFGHGTLFYAFLCDSNQKIEDIGSIKIAYLGERSEGVIIPCQNDTVTFLPKSFNSLNQNFCSLWQSKIDYLNVRRIEKKYNVKILKSLNDIVTQIDNIDELMKRDVVASSLFRFVSPFECKNEFFAIYNDEKEKNDYEYKFTYEKGDEYSDNSLIFKVNYSSCPPTNIHALIGPNGSGKTHTIKKIIEDFLKRTSKDRQFESVFLISFNPFDDYREILKKANDTTHSKKSFTYIGMKNINGLNETRSANGIVKQFMDSYDACSMNSQKAKEWNEFIDEMLAKFSNVNGIEDLKSIDGYDTLASFNKFREKVKNAFKSLSAGYKGVVSIVASTIASMAKQSLVLMDEPENHLHPPLLSMLIRWLSNILKRRHAFAIIATHSPIVLQEIPKSCVSIIRRTGSIRKIWKPNIETFGANLSLLTYEVFGYEIENAGFNCLLKEAAEEFHDYDEALEKFGGCLGDEAKTRLRIFCCNKEK